MCAINQDKKIAFNNLGFTLIEMIVAVALFSFVMLGAIGALLSIIDANRKAEAIKSSVNNLNMALESMTRNLRTGSAYDCGGVGGGDCRNRGSTLVAFKSYNGRNMQYRLNNAGGIEVSDSLINGGQFFPITSPEINVDHLLFFVDGANPNDNKQPSVFIVLGGTINASVAGQAKIQNTRFDIETMVSQRLPDIQSN